MHHFLNLLMLLELCEQIYASTFTNATRLENYSPIHRVLRSYHEHDDKSYCSKSNYLNESGFLHLGVGAILSLTIMFFRTYIPNFLTRLIIGNGRAMPNSDQINWLEFGQYAFEKSNDPLAPILNAIMKARFKSKLTVNATVGKRVNLDCINQLLCQTTKEAALSSSRDTLRKKKLQLLLRSAILLLVSKSNSFFDLMHPITAGHFGYNCSKQFPSCDWEQLS